MLSSERDGVTQNLFPTKIKLKKANRGCVNKACLCSRGLLLFYDQRPTSD